ncbi:MAG: hypothetical protein ABIR81_03780 [Ginsengibacter sp.]
MYRKTALSRAVTMSSNYRVLPREVRFAPLHKVLATAGAERIPQMP